MGILKSLAKDLLADTIVDNIPSVSLKKHGKKIAAGAGIAAAAGLTGAMLGRKTSQSGMAPAAQVPEDVPPLPAQSAAAVPSLPSGPPAPPAFSFYAMIEGKQRGPYDELQFKRLVENDLASASTLVWKEGMSDWMPAGEVKMMASIFPQRPQVAAAPPAPAAPAMPQMPQRAYYVNLNNQQVGPFNVQQLQHFAQTGEFTQQMFVWCEGMPQWLAAGAVPELAGIFGPAMPQMPNV